MDDLLYLGKYIKLQRERHNLNISQLAYKCNYSRSYLSQIESGRVLPSAKLEETINTIFTCLNMNYKDYLNTGELLQADIDDILKYIFFNIPEQRDALYMKLKNSEQNLISYKVFPRYCLSKFVYNVFVKNNIDSEIENLKKSLLDNINIFDLKDKSIIYTFVGVYFRKKADHSKSEVYLLKSLEFGEFKDISGITYYELSVTQSLMNHLVSALINIQNSTLRFNSEGNYKRLIYSKNQEAIILGRCKEFERADNILKEILNNYQITDKLKTAILINQAQIKICQKNFDKVIQILDEIDIMSDNVVFMKLLAYYKLLDKTEFNDFYEKNHTFVTKSIFKNLNKILYLKMNCKKKIDEYVHLLLDSLSCEDLKYDVDIELFILNELIEYYEELGKYKASNKYLKRKLDLLEM